MNLHPSLLFIKPSPSFLALMPGEKMWFKHILEQQDLPESAEPSKMLVNINCPIHIDQYLHRSQNHRALIFQQYTRIKWIFSLARDTALYTLFLHSAVISQQQFFFQWFSWQQESLGLWSITPTPSVQPGRCRAHLWLSPCWCGHTEVTPGDPHQSGSSWHPHRAFGSPGWLRNGIPMWQTACQPIYLQEAKPTMESIFSCSPFPQNSLSKSKQL